MIRSTPSRHAGRPFITLLIALGPAALAAGGCDGTTTPKVDVAIPATGLAVLNSDYSSTSVSLVDPVTRTLVHDDCVDSNTVPPTLSLALSRDVMLPSRPQVGGDVLLLDNENDALTWVDPQSCTIRHQLAVSDFKKSFPHDVISISADKAYVTRFGTNPNPSDDPLSRGEDLLIINPRSMTVTMTMPAPTIIGRIDMAPYAAPVAGVAIQARPDHGLLIGGKVYVTLASQDAGYLATGEGRIVIVDAATDQVTGMIALTGLAGCSRLDYAASTKTLLVVCGGASSAADQAATSGLAMVDLGVEPPALKGTVAASALGGKPLNFSWVASLPDQRVLAATFGIKDFLTGVQSAPDALWSIVPDTGVASKLLEGGAFNLGRAALLDSPATLFVPDGDSSNPLLHVLQDANTTSTPAPDLDANPSQHLPPREVAWY